MILKFRNSEDESPRKSTLFPRTRAVERSYIRGTTIENLAPGYLSKIQPLTAEEKRVLKYGPEKDATEIVTRRRLLVWSAREAARKEWYGSR